MSILLRYLMIFVACCALLLGIQLPNLADQYTKRVDAHLREVTVNFQPYQEIANNNTQGNIYALIELHRKSDSPVFKAEADAIERMFKRKRRFEAEAEAMRASLPIRIAHVLLLGDSEIREETLTQYSATVPLNQDAIVMGAVAALVILLVFELLLLLLARLRQIITRWINHRWRGA